jgi:putative hydrolase of the HAD superfamily
VAFGAVIFDLYWTLLYEEETGLMDAAMALAEKVGADPDAWHEAWGRTLHASWRNELSLLGRARESLKAVGVAEPDGEVTERLAGLMAARSTPRLYPDVPESLAAVKGMGLGMGLISNISAYRAGWLKEIELAPLFDVMALSCELGTIKPEPAIYLGAVEGLGLKPEECVFVDDVPPYVQAAAELGMATVRINRFESDEIYRQYYDDLSCDPDLEIDGLGELVEWLKARRGD